MAGVMTDLSLRLSANTANLKNDLNDATKDLKNFSKGVSESVQKTVDSFKGLDAASSSFKELRTAMRTLNSMPFAGKSKEDILVLNTEIGRLKDEMGDLKGMQKGLGTEFGNVATSALRGLAGLAEVGFAIGSVMGMSKENSAQLQAKMTMLIGAVQGLGEFQAMLGDQTLRVVAIRIKETVATMGQTVATNLHTAAQWLFNLSLGAMVAIITAGVVVVAALGVGLYYLYGWLTKSTDAEKEQQLAIKLSNEERVRSKQIMEEVADTTQKTLIPQKVHIESLVASIKNENNSLADKKRMLGELIALDPKYLSGLTLANVGTQNGKNLIDNYISALGSKAQAMSYESMLVKLYSDKYTDSLSYENLLLGIQAEKIVYTNRMKAMDFSFGEAQKLKEKIAGEELLAATVKTRINTNVKGIKDIETALSKIKVPDVDYNTGTSSKTGKEVKETRGVISSSDSILNRRLTGEAILYKAGADNLLNIKKDFDKTIIGKRDDMYTIIPDPEPAHVNKTIMDWKIVLNDFNKSLSNMIVSMGENLGALMGDAFANMFDKSTSNKDKWKSFGAGILSSIGGFMQSLGQQLIIMGGLAEIIQTALATIFIPGNVASATALIVSGIAFIAAGSALSSLVGKGFANGGVVGGNSYSGDKVPIMANSGEMVLNGPQQAKLFAMITSQSMMGNRGQVEFEIKGDKLVGVLNNYGKKINSTR